MVFRKVLNNNLQPTRKTTQLHNIIKSVLLLIILSEAIPGVFIATINFGSLNYKRLLPYPASILRHSFQTKRNPWEELIVIKLTTAPTKPNQPLLRNFQSRSSIQKPLAIHFFRKNSFQPIKSGISATYPCLCRCKIHIGRCKTRQFGLHSVSCQPILLQYYASPFW